MDLTRPVRTAQVEHMLKLGNLPAAAELLDHFGLHGEMPPLDPALVEAAARQRAAAHLQLAISDSRVREAAAHVDSVCCCCYTVGVVGVAVVLIVLFVLFVLVGRRYFRRSFNIALFPLPAFSHASR